MTSLLLRRAELSGHRIADVRIAAGVITDIASHLNAAGREEVINARGGALLPGLCDHHLHLHALAAAATSVQCGPPAVTGPGPLAAALAIARPDDRGWIGGIGYSEDVAGLPDAGGLDRLHATRPVRIQHRSGALWLVNTAGARLLGLATADDPGIERNSQGAPTGRLWRADSFLRTRLPSGRPPALGPVGSRLARLGITHVTDATPDLDDTAIGAITAAMRTGALPQHVLLLGTPAGWAPEQMAPGSPRAPVAGPTKIVLADSGLPDLHTLIDAIRAAHASGRAVAVHCVSRDALILLEAALDDAGTRPGDRIEHGAMIPAALIPRLRDLKVAVVTQPGFLSWRGDDYRRNVPAAEHDDLYRVRSLLEAGVGCAISSDAPYGPLDPWAVIAAAAQRRTPTGQVIGPAERIPPALALTSYLTHPASPEARPRTVAIGAAADLALLRVPLAQALAEPSADQVAVTIVGGMIIDDA